jgi:single-strand selective monofunctional uracil DNA glycosylase
MAVRDWSATPGVVLPVQHPKRPLLGHKCKNIERSGQRLWSLAKNRWDSPEAFFSQVWVHNYCPLAFVRQSKNGTNFTPDKLKKEERLAVESACDEALKEIIQVWTQTHNTTVHCQSFDVLAE